MNTWLIVVLVIVVLAVALVLVRVRRDRKGGVIASPPKSRGKTTGPGGGP